MFLWFLRKEQYDMIELRYIYILYWYIILRIIDIYIYRYYINYIQTSSRIHVIPPISVRCVGVSKNPEPVGVSMVFPWCQGITSLKTSAVASKVKAGDFWRFLDMIGLVKNWSLLVMMVMFTAFLEIFDWTSLSSFGHWTTLEWTSFDFRNPTSETNLGLKEPISGKSWKDGWWPWVYHIRNGVIVFCEGVECGVYCPGGTHRGLVKLGRSNDVATHVVDFLAVKNKIFGHSQTHCWMIQKSELISILWVFCFLKRKLEISSWHCEMNGDGK